MFIKKKILSMTLALCIMTNLSISAAATSATTTTVTSPTAISAIELLDSSQRKVDTLFTYDLHNGNRDASLDFKVGAWVSADHNAFSTKVESNLTSGPVYITIKNDNGYYYESSSFTGTKTFTTTNAGPDDTFTVTVHLYDNGETHLRAMGTCYVTSHIV